MRDPGKDEGIQGMTRADIAEAENDGAASLHAIPSIPPPIPERQAVLEVLGSSDSWKDELIKKGLPPLDLEEEGGTDTAGTQNNNMNIVPSDLGDAATSASGTASSIRNDSERSGGGRQTVVYDGSDARVEIASPLSASVGTNAQQPVVYGSNQPYHVPEAYLVESTGIQPRRSWFTSRVTRGPTPVVAAVQAEPIEPAQPWYKRRSGRIIIALAVLLCALALIVIPVLASQNSIHDGQNGLTPTTSSPTHSPTHDQRPTLDIVRSRDVLRCGFGGIIQYSSNITSIDYEYKWVRVFSTAAVLLLRCKAHRLAHLYTIPVTS